MKKEYVNIAVQKGVRRRLKVLAASLGLTHNDTIEKLLDDYDRQRMRWARPRKVEQ